jgi:rhodanese-related sulfurtransferase
VGPGIGARAGTLLNLMAAEPDDRELAPARVFELVSAGEAQIVDVRTEPEHAAGHVAGDTHIRFEELPARAAELDRSRPVVFYCESGGRSAGAAEAFAASGWRAHTMTGGLAAWAEDGLPLEPDGGEVTHKSGLPDAPASA